MNSSFQQANQWRRLGCLEEAVIAYQKAIQSHPNFYWTYQKLGETLHQLARLEEAVTSFRQAIAVNPTARWSYFYLGEVLAQQQEWEDAIASYQKAIALNLTEPQVFWGLGQALEALKCWDEAIATYQKTIELNVNQYKSYQYLGNLLLRQRQWTEAVAAHEKAVQLSPKSSASKNNLGRALYYLGKSLAEQNLCSEAVDQYRQALDLGFDKGQVHYHLGKGLNQLGRYEEAVVELKQALKFNPLFLEWEQELEYALNKLERTLETESTDIWTTQVSQPDIKELNQLLIRTGLDSPKNDKNHYKLLVISGWILPKKHDLSSVKVIAKSDKYEHEELLSVARRDVITKILKDEPEEHPLLCCGFRFEVPPAERIEIDISIEGHQYHWKTIESTPVLYKVIGRIQQTWRNYITNNLQDISPEDAELLSSLPPAAFDRYIYGKPESANRGNLQLAINYLDLSDAQKQCFENFFKSLISSDFPAKLLESALTRDFLKMLDPFTEDYAISCESFHLNPDRTVLRFIISDNKTLWAFQRSCSIECIYFSCSNFIVTNRLIRQEDVYTFILNFIRDFTDNKNYTIKSYKNNFGGVIVGSPRPSHFYYDYCSGLSCIPQKILNQIPCMYSYPRNLYFSIKSLFDLMVNEYMIERDEIIEKSRHDQEFYISLGSNDGITTNANIMAQEKLSEMIVSTASELVDDATAKEVKRARECYPLMWFGVTVQKRAWVEQVEGGAKIITELAKIYPNIGVVFDGWTAPLNPTQSDINEAAKDQAVVDEIVQLLPLSVRTFTVVGSTTVRKLAFATVIDVFIANKGTGSIHVDRFAKKPGVVHISNSFRLLASKLLHYNVVNVPSNQVVDVPHPTQAGQARTSYSINPDVILNLVKEILAQSNP